MGARTGEQFLERLRKTSRVVWVGNDRVDDVTAHPELAGAATTLAGVFDRLLEVRVIRAWSLFPTDR